MTDMTGEGGAAGRRAMGKAARRGGTAALALALAAAAVPAAAEPRAPLNVVADIAPVQSLAAMGREGAGAPALIVTPGASPHGYALRPSQAGALQDAEIVFQVGAGLAPWLSTALEGLAGGARVITLAEAPGVRHLAVREDAMFGDGPGETHGHDEDGGEADGAAEGHDDDHGHGHAHAAGMDDPHLWLNPDNALAWIEAIEAALSEADPGRAELYDANADRARARIAAAAETAEARLAGVHGRPYAVFHDAYAHFERRFDMPALGAVSLGDGARPGARHLAALRDRLVAAGAVCVFSEPQFPPRLVNALTEGTGIRHAELDPLGAALTPGASLYPALIEGMAAAMADCLGG
ncbi:MAG: zinc ABC transporter substrate-binding protein [Pseudomonadota bacterium]|nr:zinc ABC transporter substrate-binding protein [Pseudomonadota bacterium]